MLSDEVYEGMVFDGLEHQHIATCDGMFERTISVFSVGKTSDRRVEGLPSGVAMAFKRTSISFRRCKNHSARCSYGRDRGRARRFSATGWRVGYAVGPEELIAPLVRVHQASNFATPTPLQIASAIAFDRASAFGYFDDLKASLEGKRDKLCRLLRTAGLSPIVPQGGYFLLADTTKIGIPTDFPLWEAPEDMPLRERRDFAVCRLLCERAGVTAIPASAFFSEGHRHITDSLARFCFCKQDDTLNEAFRRIVHSGLNAAWV